MEYSLLALSPLAVVSTLRELYHQAVEPIPPESYPRVLASLTHLTHLAPAIQALVVTTPLAPAAQALAVTIPPRLVVHLARALVSTHRALAPESPRPVLVAPTPAAFPHLEPLSQLGSTQQAVSDIKRDHCEGCVNGRNAFAMQEIDRKRRLSADRHGKILTTNGVLGTFNSFYPLSHQESTWFAA